MTTYNRTSLKTFFETGDVPTGQNFSDLIDSCLNIVETGVQIIAGPINPTEVITPRVSAGNLIVTTGSQLSGVTSAQDVYSDTIRASAAVIPLLNTTTVSATTVNTNTTQTSALSVTGDVSAPNSTVYASAVRSTNGMISGTGTVSAAGTTQGTAAVLTNVINRGRGVADGSTTGFTPLANRAGLVQYLLNEGPSANLWPPTGGFINGLAVNTPFPLAASSSVTIFHITASSYGVK